MSQLLTPETFAFFAKYLLAGYVVIIVRSRFVLSERVRTPDLVVEAVILSLVTQLAFQVLTWPLPPGTWLLSDERAALLAEVLVLPTIIGSLLGFNLSRGWNNAILRRLSMPVTQPVHRAHDYAFLQDRRAGLVILTYSDGVVVYGYFGERSMAASDVNRSDIYLERIYDISDTGQWREFAPPRGALLSLAGIRSIEFLDDEGETE